MVCKVDSTPAVFKGSFIWMPVLQPVFESGTDNRSAWMNILCFQHHDDEHAGFLRGLLARDGHTLTTVMLHRGESIPVVNDFDALWVLGGPMDVWQDDTLPWLRAEIQAIDRAVTMHDMPYFGLCLGHQLLATALGGTVAPGTPEIGVLPVNLDKTAAADPFMQGVPQTFQALQWHSAEIVSVPSNATVLASSPDCAVQAMRVGTRALSFQFHLEAESDTVDTWNAVPEYHQALLAALGADGARQLADACARSLAGMNALCEALYDNWMNTVTECAHAAS